MNDPITLERDALIEQITDALGDLATFVTTDAQDARPLPGKVAVYIQPPDLAWPSWDADAPDITWKAAVVAGTPATQGTSLDLLYRALARLAAHQVNIVKAEPVGYQNAAADLAAYLVTFGTITI